MRVHSARQRCAVSCTPLDSIRRSAARICGAVMSSIDSRPKAGIRYESSIHRFLLQVAGASRFFCRCSHSFAMTSKDLAAATASVCFCTRRWTLGSAPACSCLRSDSRRSRAAFSVTSG